MEIKFIERGKKVGENIVIVLDDKLSLPAVASEVKNETGIDIGQLIKVHSYKGKSGESLYIPTGSTNIKNILVFSLGDTKKAEMHDSIKAGACLYRALTKYSVKEAEVYFSDAIQPQEDNHALFDFLLGTLLGSYRFDKYKTVKKPDEDKKTYLEKLHIIVDRSAQMNSKLENNKNFSDTVAFVKDLVSEPANVLHPLTLAQVCMDLTKYGVEVEVLDENRIKQLGMGALYGVGQGSDTPPRVVVMHWNGAQGDEKKLALVGKGVTFDSGGLSIKPALGMEAMKGDMGGAAVVIGMLRMLALRKAKVNVIGAVGLVENMVSGNAQRPGDIVKSMSGQTIEVLNTDAEGRLVLADVLWYVQDKYNPTEMIDLATLTGAIRICLGDKMAGLFSNDDTLAKKLFKAGTETGEKTWILPLDKEYDKTIDSDIADMKNIASPGVGAGSTIAAQFLQRFVNKTKWAHIDIASVSEKNKASDTGLSGPTAFGMRLLNKFIEDNYER
jgi:leucyl aminopeptidase